jgi:hypothetical protein
MLAVVVVVLVVVVWLSSVAEAVEIAAEAAIRKVAALEEAP